MSQKGKPVIVERTATELDVKKVSGLGLDVRLRWRRKAAKTAKIVIQQKKKWALQRVQANSINEAKQVVIRRLIMIKIHILND